MVKKLQWTLLLTLILGTGWNVGRWIRPPSGEISRGWIVRLPPSAERVGAGGVLLVLGEECPFSLGAAKDLSQALEAHGLEGRPAHAVVVGGEPGKSRLEWVLAETWEVTLDIDGSWAERNGFLRGPMMAVLDADGRVEDLLAWNGRNGFVPFSPKEPVHLP